MNTAPTVGAWSGMMPRDDWAKARRRDRGRKALASGEYFKVSRDKPPKRKKAKRRAAKGEWKFKHEGRIRYVVQMGDGPMPPWDW